MLADSIYAKTKAGAHTIDKILIHTGSSPISLHLVWKMKPLFPSTFLSFFFFFSINET